MPSAVGAMLSDCSPQAAIRGLERWLVHGRFSYPRVLDSRGELQNRSPGDHTRFPPTLISTVSCWFPLAPLMRCLLMSSKLRMHSCLNVDEILRLFACELVASEAKATAVALACCCKRFEEPALDALWETQNQLTPLLKCFPRDVWDENGGSIVSPLTAIIFPAFNHLVSKDFQENPDKSRMDSFPKVCSKDAVYQGGCL